MTMPMMTSNAGSMIVINRPSCVSISSVEEVGNAGEHFLQCAGRLADLDHLERDRRKDAALGQRRRQ